MTCEAVQDGDLTERYLLGNLSDQEREAYEAHYYRCAACFERLNALQTTKRLAPAQSRPGKSRLLWFGVAAAALLLAFLSGLPRIWHSNGQQPRRPTATILREDTVRLLARIDPPRYTPSTLRGPGDAGRMFRTAMESYTRADYAAAAQGLEQTLRGGPEAAGPRFYLGICDLLLGKIDAAVAELKRAGELGDTPFLEPARFFLAKALLAQNDLDGAEHALTVTVELKGDQQEEARRLLEQVRALRAR